MTNAQPPAGLEIGKRMVGTSRTVTDAEIAILPALMGAISPLFHDEVRARQSAMQGRILYGPAVLGIAIALTEHLLRDFVLGLVELRSVRFRRPVRSGDTLTGVFRVVECHERGNKPGLLLHLEDEAHNQDGEIVLKFERVVLVRQPDDLGA